MKRATMLAFCMISGLAFVQAQVLMPEQMVGTWIGVHSEWDTNVFCSLPTYIQLDADSTYHLGMVDGSATAFTSTWAVNSDRVRLDTIHFAPKLITQENDLLRIGRNYPMVFRRFKHIPLDSIAADQQLSGRVWQSDSLILYLYTNGQITLENPISKERTAHFWRLVTFRKSLFLVIQGNQYTREGNYKALWQLSSQAPKQMEVIGWNGHAVARKTFQLLGNLASGDSCRPTGFQTCDNCFIRALSEMWVGKSQSRYDLNQLIAQYYKPLNCADQSGLIRIQFVVNCEGQSGMFTTNCLGNDYCPKAFDTQITDQLLAICRNHIASGQFLRSNNQTGERSHDMAVSFTVRLLDGHITDILP